MFGFSHFKGIFAGKMSFFAVKTLAADEKQRCWGSFCLSGDAESKYVDHSQIHRPMFGFSQFKGILQGKIEPFDATDVLVEEKVRSRYSFCSS